MAKEKRQEIMNKKGIKYQIQSKISIGIAAVMALVMILVVVVVYNLIIDANSTEVKQDAEAVALQVEKFFAPFERMAEQMALDVEVRELCATTVPDERMNENPLYDSVLKKWLMRQSWIRKIFKVFLLRI